MPPPIVVSAVELPDQTWAIAITTSESPDLPAGEPQTIRVANRRRPPHQDDARFREEVVDEVLRAARAIGAAAYLGPGLQPPLVADVAFVEHPPEGVALLAALPRLTEECLSATSVRPGLAHRSAARADALRADLDRWVSELTGPRDMRGTAALGAGLGATTQFEAFCRSVLQEHLVSVDDRATFGVVIDNLKHLDKRVGLDGGRRALAGRRGVRLDRLNKLRNKQAHGRLDQREVLELLQSLGEVMDWMAGQAR